MTTIVFLLRRAAMLGMLTCFIAHAAQAEAPRVLPDGKTPQDSRLGPLKDLDGYFPFAVSKDKAAWDQRAEQVRRRILVANGLWPMPAKTPANAVVHGKIDRDTYTVERVYFESYPGHFVTGSLYRPKGKPGKHPGVLFAHGHWANGRFFDAGDKDVRKQIVEGGERFEIGGRYPLQAICVQLARMGCVVFSYDMVGYADSVQIPFVLAHGFAQQRPAFDTPENWGFFSTQAELRQQSIMGLQTYNSIRALDWLCDLPDVDTKRIGVTGASGGGTQTFILCAIDSRPTVAFPAVMVSTSMQGGCTCENCSNLRIGTGNVEFAALTAPRPLGMTGAMDWTREIETKGLPELKQHYAMLGVPERVMGKALLQFGHNYNYVSREVMYQWFNKHLELGLADPVVEENYMPLSVADMTVWDEKHPKPKADGAVERALIKVITEDADRQLAALAPSDAASLATFRAVYGGGVDVLIGRGLPAAGDIEHQVISEQARPDHTESRGLVRYKPAGEELPWVMLRPKNWNNRIVIWAHPEGKQGLYGSSGQPTPEVTNLLAGGSAVVAADLLYQGEFNTGGQGLTAPRRVNNKREFAGYTAGYNSSLFAQRVHDLLSLVAMCGKVEDQTPRVDLFGKGAAGAWAAAARAQAGAAVSRTAIDTEGFRFAKVPAISDLNFMPGGAKYGDLPGMLALAAPAELWLAGEGSQAPPLVTAAYGASGKKENLAVIDLPAQEKMAAAIKWLSRP